MLRQRLARSLLASLLAALLTLAVGGRARADSRPVVAVLYFDYAGKDGELAVLKKGLAQMLITDLGALDGIRLVERDRLEEVLAELKLAQSGKVDSATAAKIGKLLGARYLVLGSYFDLKNTLRADVRVVEVETGKQLKVLGHTSKPDDFLSLEQKLSEDLTKALGDSSVIHGDATPPGPGDPKAPAPAKPRVAPPAALKTKTALAYSRALDAADRKDKARAKKELEAVVKEQPDFKLATLDLSRFSQ